MSHQKNMNSGVIVASVAKVLVMNEKDEALVLTIGEYKEYPHKSHTADLPGGQVEIGDGENEMAGAIRETEEESGIILDPTGVVLAYAGTQFYVDKQESVSKFLYVAKLDHTPEIVISWEHESYEWVPITELLERKTFRPFYQEAIEYSITAKLV